MFFNFDKSLCLYLFWWFFKLYFALPLWKSLNMEKFAKKNMSCHRSTTLPWYTSITPRCLAFGNSIQHYLYNVTLWLFFWLLVGLTTTKTVEESIACHTRQARAPDDHERLRNFMKLRRQKTKSELKAKKEEHQQYKDKVLKGLLELDMLRSQQRQQVWFSCTTYFFFICEKNLFLNM